MEHPKRVAGNSQDAYDRRGELLRFTFDAADRSKPFRISEIAPAPTFAKITG
jgi:hypothetical protein